MSHHFAKTRHGGNWLRHLLIWVFLPQLVSALQPAANAQTALCTTYNDFSQWTANAGSTVSADNTWSADTSTINGAGNATAAGATGTSGSLLIQWASSVGNYNEIAAAPSEGGNAAFLSAIDPGQYGSAVAASGNIYLDYSLPDNEGGNYFELGVLLQYAADGYYQAFFPSSTADLGYQDDYGEEVYRATIPYTITAGQFNGFGFGIIYNSNYSPALPFHVDDITVSTAQTPTSGPANVTINATNVINTVPTNAFGIFMAVWDTWGGSTPTQLKQSGITTMRYPGGGYADNYHWSSYLMTPFDGQAGSLGYLSGATDMGHFIQLMSNAQAQAVISVDWGSGFLWNANKTAMAIPSTNGSPQEAAAWVAYCNSSTNIYGTTNDVTIGVDALGNNWQTAGYWAMIRAASPLAQNDGYNFLRIKHPAPVHIQYWEVGNEPYGNAYYSTGTAGYECDYAVPYPYTTYPRYSNALLSPAAYGQAVKAFSIAMKAVDPTIKVGAYSSTPPGDYSWDYISGVNNGQHWTPQVLAQCGSNIDFVIVHWYPNFSDNVGTSLLSEVGSIIPVMISGTGPYPHTGTNSGLEDWITNYCPNPANVQILVTEFGADNYPYLVAGTNGMPILGPVEALFAADCYSTWLNYPAFANADWLDFDGDSFLGSGSNGPVVCAMQMLRHLCNPGDAFVKAASDTSTLRVQGVVRQDGNLGILLINESINSSQTVNVTVTNANLKTTGTIYQFGTNNWTSTNEVPATGPGSNSLSSVGSTFSVTLPAYTMDVLVIPVLGNTPPVLAAISNQTVNVGQTVAFTASATDTDQPPPTLTFALLAGATNATLNTNTGAFSWRPLVTQANSTNLFTLKVSDGGTPVLSATQSFTVAVNPLTAPSVSPVAWLKGQFALQVSGETGPDYAVLSSTNLIDWGVLFETNSPAMPFEWINTNAAISMQFYRIQVGPPLP
ncbi:MAG: hypothetical protein ACLPYZ_00775 [Limisphaerales bacterium]